VGKFSFRLQAVLNIKKQTEDNLKNELGKALQRLEHEKQVLLQLQEGQDSYVMQLNTAGKKGIIVDKIREFNIYIRILHDHILKQKTNITNAQKNADNYREQLVKAVQEREILEKLKERQYQEYLHAIVQEEQKQNDEVAGYKYFTGMAGEQDGCTKKRNDT
jgi:flagellar FliJ protein